MDAPAIAWRRAAVYKESETPNIVKNLEQLIAQAGWPGTVTIATNMAGRGTDIQLGGNFEAEIADFLTKYADLKTEGNL